MEQQKKEIEIGEIVLIAEKHESGDFDFECEGRAFDGFVYFIKGDGTLTIRGTTLLLPVMDGMLFFFHRGDRYRFSVPGGCHYVTAAYRIEGTTDVVLPPFPSAELATGKTELEILRMAREWESHRAASYMRCKIALLSLYAESFIPDREAEGDPLIYPAVEFIRANFRRPFTGQELATHLSVSLSYLRQRFRAVLGVSMTEYRDRLRIAAAREMLESRLFTPKETAYSLGYSDVYHFTKVFRARVGVTPARYKNDSR